MKTDKIINTNSIVKNTVSNNLVNYSTNDSSAAEPQTTNYNSVDPTSLSNITKDSPLIKYSLSKVFEKQVEK